MAEEKIESQVETADAGTDVDFSDTESLADFFDTMDGGEEVEQKETAEPEASNGEPGAEEEQAPVQAAPMPEGWEEAMWSGLAPEVQGRINQAMQEHAQALAVEKKAQQDLMAKQHAYNQQVEAQLRNTMALMKSIVEAEYGGIDWNAVAQSDPAAYVQLQQQYAQRMQGIRALQQNITEKAAQIKQYNEQQTKALLDNEYDQVLPEVKALVGSGFEGKQFANDIASYLQSQGVPAEAINGIERGYELKLATKAMLYDKLMNHKAAAAKKVAEAPKVQTPRGAVSDTNGGRLAKAKSVLARNPNSTDALAAVFDAM